MPFVEECWVLKGLRVGKLIIGYKEYLSTGKLSEVYFNYDALDKKWVVGWYHTHPGIKNIIPSSTDDKTMRSWVKTFYKSYLCGIVCGDMSACYCYYVSGLYLDKSTKVGKRRAFIKFIGPLFISLNR